MHTFVQFKSAAKVQKKIDIRKRTCVFLVFYLSCQFFFALAKVAEMAKLLPFMPFLP